MDDNRFSTQVIPEPTTFALLAAGAALFSAPFVSHRPKSSDQLDRRPAMWRRLG